MKAIASVVCVLFLLPIALSSYAGDPSVVELDPESFEKKLAGSGLWLVKFYAPWCGHCKSLQPVWSEVGQALSGIVNVAAVDAEAHKSLAGNFGVQGFPSLKLISVDSASKLKATDYNGDRSAKSIIEWTLREAKKIALKRIGAPSGKESRKGKEDSSGGFYGKSSDVISLTDATFHEEVDGESLWMVMFYAPWCGHCKNLKPEWADLATNVKGKARIGAVDCTVQKATCQEFGVQGYPTVKVFREDRDSPSDYQGGRDSGSLTEFIMAEWKKTQPPPEAKELVDQHVFEKECTGNEDEPAKKLCLVAFMPNILDTKAAGRREYIKALSRLADKYADRPFSFLWAEGGAQPKLENALGVGGYGYPAFIALNPKEGKYASLREAFSAENAIHFVESLRSGHERVASVEESIPEVGSIAPWDGGDGQALEEEEFSLEDLMSDEDDKSEL